MTKICDPVVSCLKPYISGSKSEGDSLRQQSLMDSLKKYVEQDDEAAINSLLDDKKRIEWIVKGLKQSPYSLLHQAAAQRKDKALMAMMKKLPIEVWNFRTQENLEHTPPIMGGRTPIMFAAESNNGEIIFELRYGVSCYVCDRQSASGQALSQVSAEELDVLRAEFKCPPGRVWAADIWWLIVNAKDDEGNTPLLLAVNKARYESFYQLLTARADPDIANREGHTARSVILDSPDGPIREFFLESAPPPPSPPSLSVFSRMGCTIL
ncbi:hypothetical protein GCM10027287_42910 [Bordetella muralis]